MRGRFQLRENYRRAYDALYGRRPIKASRFRRDLLPDPTSYYTRHLYRLRAHGGWAAAQCPFHTDKYPSLSVSLLHGGYICHACGARGGDVLDFHRQLTGLGFIDAAKDLNTWEGA
jgi:hypothetical protein